PGVAVFPAAVEGGALGIDHGDLGVVPAIADVTAEGGARAPGSRAHDDPGRDRVAFGGELAEHALGDVVVPSPVCGPLGVGELVQVVSGALRGQAFRLRIHLRCAVDEVAAAAVELDQVDLLLARGPRHDGDERQPEHPREVRLRHRRRPARRLHQRRALRDPPVHQPVQDQRP
ncbi:hypothetical protein ABE10_00350, partial [Bacillus toyonensis]|nr:hypothetical protein [Bacillus toyonensis]